VGLYGVFKLLHVFFCWVLLGFDVVGWIGIVNRLLVCVIGIWLWVCLFVGLDCLLWWDLFNGFVYLLLVCLVYIIMGCVLRCYYIIVMLVWCVVFVVCDGCCYYYINVALRVGCVRFSCIAVMVGLILF